MDDTGFCCMNCGETLKVADNLSNAEFDDAVKGFMIEHVDKHGGDPAMTLFRINFEGQMLRAVQ